MWSVTVIAVVAVTGAVGLLVVAVPLAVSIERRRHRKLMQQHGLSGRLSIHRPNLSVNENNYAHVPRPTTHVRRSGGHARLSNTWTTVPSEESIEPVLEDIPVDEPLPPTAKWRKGIPSSLYGPAFHLPKTRRQKKIQKAIAMNQMPQSPLSAITEFTDSAPDTPITELPTEMTPRGTPDRAPKSPQLHVARTRAKTLSQDIPDKSFARSVSMTSTATAPVEDLPPLPTGFDTYKGQRPDFPRRISAASVETVASSVLLFSSPSKGTDIARSSANDGMQTFDFGFKEKSARLGVPPGRQAMQGFCSGKTGIISVRPSVDYHNGRAISLETASHNHLKATDYLRTIDASSWDLQGRSHTRHSMQDCGSVLGKRDYLNQSVSASSRIMPRRPASVATGNPYQWDLKAAFSASRLSAGSLDTKKGHRRQNCVRISNLPIMDKMNSRVGQMPELQEEQSDPGQIQIPGLTLLEAGRPVLRARASLVDVTGSPSPLQNRPVLIPTGARRPSSYRTSSSSLALARPDSDVFSTGQPEPRTPDISRPRQWPLSPTPPSNIKLNSPSPSNMQYESPTLPPPINAANIFPRRSRLMGPRNPPTAFHPRTGSPSPIGNKAVPKRAPDELRKSIMALRSMNSEGRLLDLPPNRNYSAIGEEDDDLSQSPTLNSLNSNYPRERRYGSQAFGARSKSGITRAPSGMSLGGTSIWEDVSVRGDSPEPDLPPMPSPIIVLENVDKRSRQQLPQTPKSVQLPFPDPEAYENISPMAWGNKQRYQSPQGRGLGLKMGNALMGTPGSLYDGDGFLKV